MSTYGQHQSVLLDEVLQGLLPTESLLSDLKKQQKTPVLLDCTLGRAGHTLAALKACPALKVIAFDQDHEAIAHASELLTDYFPTRFQSIHANFASDLGFETFKKLLGDDYLVGVLADLGVSSHHFDSDYRGFSFRKDGPLDMRMDQGRTLTAKDIINHYTALELLEVIGELGEEPFAKKIVQLIVEKRSVKEFERTSELEEVCFLAYPKALRHRSRHPATLTFQALRMEVNSELTVLRDLLAQLSQLLPSYPGCTLGVISFHSLEDRIVKHTFKDWKKNNPFIQVITKRPLVATDEEVASNPRSRSAKLRLIRF